MSLEVYEIPDNIDELFKDVLENEGYMSYRIIDYSKGMDMDNITSMTYFLDCVGVIDEYIVEDLDTQVVLRHPYYHKHIVIDSSGLGDFFSHGFDCEWVE